MSRLSDINNIDANDVINKLKAENADLSYSNILLKIKVEKLMKLSEELEIELQTLKED